MAREGLFDLAGYRRHFPHPERRPIQDLMARSLTDDGCRGVHEAGTGTGKTVHGIAALRAARAAGAKGPLFYVTPTKAQVDQIQRKHPGLRVVYGRSEHPCLYYRSRGVEVNAAEVPCATLCAASLCPHEVNQETGETRDPSAEACPYFQQKFEAKTGAEPVVTTTAFFLMSMVYARDWEETGYVVIDEAHRIANVARGIFQFDLTDYHIRRCMVALRALGDRRNALVLRRFLDAFRRMARRKPSPQPTLLRDEDTTELVDVLRQADATGLPSLVKQAITSGALDPIADRTTLKLLEDLTRNITRYVDRLRYALPDEERDRKPLNFVFAFYISGDLEEKKTRYHLVIKSYYVAPLIRLAVGSRGLAMSATIGGQDGFRYETGITWPFHSFPPPFSAQRTRLYVPTDTPNLAKKARSRDDLKHALRTIVETVKRFADAGQRSLVIVQSNDELTKFCARAVATELDVVSYGNGVTAREAAAAFKEGRGQVLAGTSAHFAEGVDLPEQVAPVIFFLRPGYPHPDDPQTQFEQRREGSRCWSIWQRRVMIEALQARGRNIRSGEDLGVCFFISQQFRRIVGGALPAWLEPAYHAMWTLDRCVNDALALLGTK